MNKRFYQLRRHFLQLMAVLIFSVTHCMTPEAIRGLSTCFIDQRLSPLQGAIFWEAGIVRNYFDQATLYPPTKQRWLNHPDGPVRLARALFAINAGNFDVSNNSNYPAMHMAPSTITSIILYLEQMRKKHVEITVAQLEDLILHDQAFSQSLAAKRQEYELTCNQFDQEIAQAQQPSKQLSTESQKNVIQQLKESRTIALNKLDTQRLCRNWELTQKVLKAHARLAVINTLVSKEKQKVQKEKAQLTKFIESADKTEPGGDYNRIAECAQAIIDSTVSSPHYPSSIAYWLLLAFAYRKAQSKTELAHYVNTLAQELQHAPCRSVGPEWSASMYQPTDMSRIREQLAATTNDLSLILGTTTYEDFVYTAIIDRFYAGPLPKIAEYKTICWHTKHYADCAETTLRNLCNIILYNRQAGMFDIAQAPHGHLSQQLLEFYNDPLHKLVTNIELPDVHHHWVQLLHHQPLITYRSMLISSNTGTEVMLKAPLDTMGFIYGLPEDGVQHDQHHLDRIIIGNRAYIVVNPEKAFLCEMHPTLRNFIIMFDRLFELHIFETKNLSREFLHEHFNQIYLPQLCTHFNVLNNVTFTPQQLREFDLDEYTHKGVRLRFQQFDMTLTNDHAEIIPLHQKTATSSCGKSLIKTLAPQSNQDVHWQLTNLLALWPVHPGHLPTNNSYPCLLYLPVTEPYAKVDSIVYCLKKLSQTDEYSHIINYAACQLSLLPERLDWMYHRRLIPRLAENFMHHEPIKKVVDTIVDHAMSLLHEHTDRRSHVPLLLRELVKKGYYFEQAKQIAQEYITSEDLKERKRALKLFTVLTKQGQALEQASQAVQLTINTEDQKEYLYATQLRTLLEA